MPGASYVQPGFLGGEISQFAQGRFDKPDYRISLNACYNAFPTEAGTWVRRPGSQYAGHTRGGAPGRVIKFDFEQANAVTMEFTDGKLRFRNGVTLITTNDGVTVAGVSTANPAVVQVNSAVTWPSGATVIFDAPGPAPLLENRQFVITPVDGTHFSLADALTGAGIDGSKLGAITPGTYVRQVHELTTSYVSKTWTTLRSVQAEKTSILLCSSVPPQALTVSTEPATGANAQFSLAGVTFNDGPYLDPFTNGVQATPGGTSGIIGLELSFPTWSATTAYARGSFVTSSSVNYVSLVDQNTNNTPSSSPSFWQATSAGAAINNGQGFLGTDIGRLVRLYSEPAAWDTNSTYATSVVVAYNPSGVPGAATYWQNQVNGNQGKAPGADLTNWKQIPQGAAIWTWGKITSLINVINPQLSGSVALGNLNQNGGVNAAFDGVFSKGLATAARLQVSSSGSFPEGTKFRINTFVGKDFTGATAQRISSAAIFPTTDEGFGKGLVVNGAGIQQRNVPNFTFNLYASQTSPGSGSENGTLLGTVGPISTNAAVSIPSSDTTTAWNYIWVEVVLTATQAEPTGALSYVFDIDVAQLSFIAPAGTGTAGGVNVEILGDPLLYGNPIVTWQLGLFTANTYPTCGVYQGGRLWLGGAVGNRFDASKSGGVNGSVINMAPTDAYGVVADDNAISYTLDSDSVDPIFWMMPDLQGIIMGTQAREYLVLAPTSGPITPTNIDARPVTKIGCANVEPRRTDHTTVFVQRFTRKLMEYFPDVFSGKFSAPNLADKAQHITRNGIAEIAYQSAVTPIIWGRDLLGALLALVYKRDTLATSTGPTFAAWSRHGLGSGRIVESICVGPSVGGDLDSLTMVTNDTTANIRHVEALTDAMDELNTLQQATYLDDAVAPTSMSISTAAQGVNAPYGGVTFNGLWHLNGKTVQVFAGGLDCGDPGENKDCVDFTVNNGSVFVPFGDGVSAGSGRGLFTYDFVQSFNGAMPVLIGFTFTSQGQTLRPVNPNETGARNGPAFGKIKRNHRYAIHVSGSFGLSVGGDFSHLYQITFRQADDNTPIDYGTTYTGIYRDTLDDDYTLDGMIAWQVTRPYPANIVAIGGFLETQDQ